jgi:prolyl-tRNA synthetase
MGALVTDHDGNRVPVHMGSHGIGVSRLVGAIIEACHDENGIIWPEGVTPFHVGIVNLKQGDASCDTACEDLYKALTARGWSRFTTTGRSGRARSSPPWT